MCYKDSTQPFGHLIDTFEILNHWNTPAVKKGMENRDLI